MDGNTENDNGNGSLMRILPIAFLNITKQRTEKDGRKCFLQ